MTTLQEKDNVTFYKISESCYFRKKLDIWQKNKKWFFVDEKQNDTFWRKQEASV